MRLVTFRAGGGARLGVLRDDDEVVEVTDPTSMLALIDAGGAGLERVRAAAASSRAKAHRLDDLELLPPIPEPRGNVIAIGRNYEKHAAETARLEGREPSPPTIFTKAITSLTEPFGDIAIDPAVSDKIDWLAAMSSVTRC
jgi:2-keto-4-pentenoate hydratase/2-oxohepta-3-ene-1,7-dioic acid hydratase in catechol pathway